MNTKKWEGYTIEYFDVLPSTSAYIKEKRGEKKNYIVTAERQTQGMGTKGRSFSSMPGGVYLSMLTFYENFPAKEAFKIMANCAVSVCETLSFYGLKPKIKWPNDVYVQDKKISGILIENVFSGGNISSSVVGVGLNVYNPLSSELSAIAVNMAQALNRELSPSFLQEVRERLIKTLVEEKEDIIGIYRSYLGYMGEEVALIFNDECVHATLLSVDDEGRLLVKTAEGERLFSAAEVQRTKVL